MSTDFDIFCKSCGCSHHFGQRMGAGVSIGGYSSTDADGKKALETWL